MKRIFLTGPIGCGKSTLIRTVLGDSLSDAGGFVTERILEGGKLVGFDIVSPGFSAGQKLARLDLSVPELCEKVGCLSLRFLTFKEEKAERNDEAFSAFASALLLEAGVKPFAVIDEIGGFEILIPEFMKAFELFLESQVPCIGVLKSLPSAEKLSKTVALDSEYLKAAKQLRLRLESYPETEIVVLEGSEEKRALNKLRYWKEQYLRCGEHKEK